MAKPSSSNHKRSRLSLILQEKEELSGNVADWGSVTPAILVDLIQVVARLGGASRFGYTRDGGAYSVGIYLDDDRETFYFKPGQDIDDGLTRLTDMLRNAE